MYEPITHINAGDVFEGYQQYFKVLDIYEGEATVLVYAGECHRVERGPVASMIERLNAALDPDDPHDEYWEHEHPEVRPVAMWPDDGEYTAKYPLTRDDEPIDIETGEVYCESLHESRTIGHTYDEWCAILDRLTDAGESLYDFYGDVESLVLDRQGCSPDEVLYLELTGSKQSFQELESIEKKDLQ